MTTVTMNKEESIRAGLAAMDAGRPLRAEEICRDWLASRPGCADHLRLLAFSLKQQKRLEEAEKQLLLAISLKPNFPQ